MVAQTRGGGQASPKKLKFHDKLVGKGLSIDALQKKLKGLHKELAEMEQEAVDTTSLASVKKELINNSILLHKDRGVKAYTACCLADLLRLYAPDAPYTQSELRDIFSFFFKQLTTGLKGSDSPYYNEYFHLLESLSTVKSVVLVCDLPSAEELMTEIFRGCFGLVRYDLAKKIELYMADILIALIDECQSLPHDVLESIMAQFMDKNTRMDQPAYRLAVQVCNATADKLQRHVCQYFTDLIVSHSRDEDYEEVATAHELIKRLNRSCPSLLHNVVPQLEEELRVEENQIRIMATQVLGEMFADKGGADFIKKYPSTWEFWLARRNDKSTTVRLTFVDAIRNVLINSAELREPIEDALQTKFLDPDEKVRAAVCKLYSKLDYETALHHVSEAQLRALASRGLDKRHVVQIEAMNALGRLFGLALPEIESGDPAAIQQFSWIPQTILHNATASTEVKAVAEQVLADHILPLPSAQSPSNANGKSPDVDEVVWTDRLLFVMKFLDEQATNVLLGLSAIKAARPSVYERYIQCCIDNNGGVIGEKDKEAAVVQRLTATIKKMSNWFPDPQKAIDDLTTFAKNNESRLYKLLKTCMDPQTDLKSLIKALNEFSRRIEQSSASVAATMAIFVRRSSLRIVNQSSIPTLLKRIQKGEDGHAHAQAAQSARMWLTFASKHYPAMYKSHVPELIKAIADERNAPFVEVALQALSVAVEWDPSLCPNDKKTTDRLTAYAMSSNYRHAKFASRILAHTKDCNEICAQVVESIANELAEVDESTLAAHAAVLAQLATRATDAFEQQSDIIMAFLLKKVLMVPIPADPDSMDQDHQWAEDSQLAPLIRAKIFALKTCRNRCIAHAGSDSALDISQPVLRMFTTILQYRGSLKDGSDDDPKAQSRLRLQAACSLLHMAEYDIFATAISPNFVPLAVTIQDQCYEVRMAFLVKLLSRLTPQKLPSEYNVIPFLAVHDPEADMKSRATAFVSYAIKTMPKPLRVENFEMNITRLLHLIAHHPDFAVTESDLPGIARYIEFYIELIVNADNVSLLFHLAQKLKTVRDVDSHVNTENLYVASELAQHLLRAHAKSRSWSVESYPGKIKLPTSIFRPLPNVGASKEVSNTVYLPEKALTWLAEKAKEKAAAEQKAKKASSKRKAAPKANGGAKNPRTKKKRRKVETDSEDAGSSSSEEDDEDEDGENRSSIAPSVSAASDKENGDAKEERLRRGARTRAKARIKKQAKRSGKHKAKDPSSDD